MMSHGKSEDQEDEGKPPHVLLCVNPSEEITNPGAQNKFNSVTLEARPLLAQLYTPMILFTPKPAG